jgi:hypothetical protein
LRRVRRRLLRILASLRIRCLLRGIRRLLRRRVRRLLLRVRCLLWGVLASRGIIWCLLRVLRLLRIRRLLRVRRLSKRRHRKQQREQCRNCRDFSRYLASEYEHYAFLPFSGRRFAKRRGCCRSATLTANNKSVPRPAHVRRSRCQVYYTHFASAVRLQAFTVSKGAAISFFLFSLARPAVSFSRYR